MGAHPGVLLDFGSHGHGNRRHVCGQCGGLYRPHLLAIPAAWPELTTLTTLTLDGFSIFSL